MIKLSCGPMCGKKTTSGRILGVCYVLSMTSPMCESMMVLGMMVFFSWYLVDLFKGTMIMF